MGYYSLSKELFLFKETHSGRTALMSSLRQHQKLGFIHRVAETYYMDNARHSIADNLSFILGTLWNMNTKRLALWCSKIVPTLEDAKWPRVIQVINRELPSCEATFDRQNYSPKMTPLHLVQRNGFTALNFSVIGFSTIFLKQSNLFRTSPDTSG